MKSLKSFGKLTLIATSLLLTGLAFACFYSDIKLSTTAFMDFSDVKFEKRLDDNYERIVASKKEIKPIKTTTIKCTDFNKNLVKNHYWNLFDVQRFDRNEDSIPLKDIRRDELLHFELDCAKGQKQTRRVLVKHHSFTDYDGNQKGYYISKKQLKKNKILVLFVIDYNGNVEVLEAERTNSIIESDEPSAAVNDGPAVQQENDDIETESLTVEFDKVKIPSQNPAMKNIKVVSGEITVEVENKKIVEITSLYILLSNDESYEFGSVSVNPYSGQFSAPTSMGSHFNDGGFINFDGNAHTLNLRFFTGMLQDSLIVFKNKDLEIESRQERYNEPEGPKEQSYEEMVREDLAQAKLDEQIDEEPKLSFQGQKAGKESFGRHRTYTAKRSVMQGNIPECDEDDEECLNHQMGQDLEDMEEDGQLPEDDSDMEMTDVEPEQAKGFSFVSNTQRI